MAWSIDKVMLGSHSIVEHLEKNKRWKTTDSICYSVLTAVQILKTRKTIEATFENSVKLRIGNFSLKLQAVIFKDKRKFVLNLDKAES